MQVTGRKVREADDSYVLREPETAYHAHFEAEKTPKRQKRKRSKMLKNPLGLALHC